MTKKIFKFYTNEAGQLNDTQKIVNSCKKLYIFMVNHGKKPPSPNVMLRALNAICNKYPKSSQTRKLAKKIITDQIFSIRIQSSAKTKMAPIFHPIKLLELIMPLWKYKSKGSQRILLAKRQAALQAMICLMTGRRWADITRIKWETMTEIKTSLGHFIKFLIPVSKSNRIGSRIETITLKRNDEQTRFCPIKMIQSYHYWAGQPTNGFVFPCRAPNTKWIIDPINNDWSSYRCKGHWVNERKITCLGQTSSTSSFRFIHRWAIKNKWKILPTMHTFRRTCLITAKQLGLARKQINEGFGWVPNSDMIRHYTAEYDSVTMKAPAIAIATQFEQSKPFQCLDTLPFIQP